MIWFLLQPSKCVLIIKSFWESIITQGEHIREPTIIGRAINGNSEWENMSYEWVRWSYLCKTNRTTRPNSEGDRIFEIVCERRESGKSSWNIYFNWRFEMAIKPFIEFNYSFWSTILCVLSLFLDPWVGGRGGWILILKLGISKKKIGFWDEIVQFHFDMPVVRGIGSSSEYG